MTSDSKYKLRMKTFSLEDKFSRCCSFGHAIHTYVEAFLISTDKQCCIFRSRKCFKSKSKNKSRNNKSSFDLGLESCLAMTRFFKMNFQVYKPIRLNTDLVPIGIYCKLVTAQGYPFRRIHILSPCVLLLDTFSLSLSTHVPNIQYSLHTKSRDVEQGNLAIIIIVAPLNYDFVDSWS